MSAQTELTKFTENIARLKEKTNGGQDGFERQYSELKLKSAGYKRDSTNYGTSHGQLDYNRYKNRYKDILPFDHSRVVLPSVHGVKGSDYINANYIKGHDGEVDYIAAQGPLPYTVEDFWRMLWYHKSNAVVMACKLVEASKMKCQKYWTEKGQEEPFAGLTVSVINEKWVNENFVVRKITAILEGEKLVVKHFHYTAWPDHGVPSSPQPLIELLDYVHDHVKVQKNNPPLVVHCSAGCGRTGVICVVDYVWNLLKERDFSKIDIFNIVGEMRKQRHAMVQTKEQYEFVYKTVRVLIETKVLMKELHTYVNVDVKKPKTITEHKYENVELKPKPIIAENKPQIERSKPKVDAVKPKIKTLPKLPHAEPVIGDLISLDNNFTTPAVTATPRTQVQDDMDLLDSILDEYPREEDSRCPLSIPSALPICPSRVAGNSNSNYINTQIGKNNFDDYVFADISKKVEEGVTNVRGNKFDDYVVADLSRKVQEKDDDYAIVTPVSAPPKPTLSKTKSMGLPEKPVVEQRSSKSLESAPVLPTKRNSVRRPNSQNYQNIGIPSLSAETSENKQKSRQQVIEEAASSVRNQSSMEGSLISTSNAILGSSTARDRKTSSETKGKSLEKPTALQKPEIFQKISHERLVTKIQVTDNKSANVVEKKDTPTIAPYRTVEIGAAILTSADNHLSLNNETSVPSTNRCRLDNEKHVNPAVRPKMLITKENIPEKPTPFIPSKKVTNVHANINNVVTDEDDYAVVMDTVKQQKTEPKKFDSARDGIALLPAGETALYSVVERKGHKQRVSHGDSDDDDPPPVIPIKTPGAFMLPDPSPPAPSAGISDSESHQNVPKVAAIDKFKRGIFQQLNQLKHNIGEGLTGINTGSVSQPDNWNGDSHSEQKPDNLKPRSTVVLPPLSLAGAQLGFKNSIQKPVGPRVPPSHWTTCNLGAK